jgi:hypothetical protein
MRLPAVVKPNGGVLRMNFARWSLVAGVASCAVIGLVATSAAAQTAGVFMATTSTFGVGGFPADLAIGDLHSTKPLQAGLQGLLCLPAIARAVPAGCANDLVTADSADEDLSVLLRDPGDPLWRPLAPGVPLGSVDPGPDRVAIGDFNGDGRSDLVVGDEGTGDGLTVFYGETPTAGDGLTGYTGGTSIPLSITDASRVTSVTTGDLGGRGGSDIAVTVSDGDGPGELVLLKNTGSRAECAGATCFTETVLPTGPDPTDLALADLNRDGRTDIVVGVAGSGSSASAGVDTFTQDARGGYTTASLGTIGFPESIAVGDINGDGFPDIATANAGSAPGSVTVFLSTGPRGFTRTDYPAPRYTGFSSAGLIAAGDLNGDGLADLAYISQQNSTMTVLMTVKAGSGITFRQTTLPTGSGPLAIVIGHLNSGDGAQDVAVANAFASTVTVYTNTTPQAHGPQP